MDNAVPYWVLSVLGLFALSPISFLAGVAHPRLGWAPIAAALVVAAAYGALLLFVFLIFRLNDECWSCGEVPPKLWFTFSAVAGGIAVVINALMILVGIYSSRQASSEDTVEPYA